MGATAPILNEELFWFGDDDGTSEADNTFKGSKNSNQLLDVDTNYRYRTSVSNTGDKASNNTQLQFEYNKGGAGWNPVNAASSVVRMAASTKLTEGNNCTERLAGAQTFEGTNGGQEDGDGLINVQVDLGISNELEADFCFTIVSGDVVNLETIVVRVTDAGTPLDNYNQTPIITVNEVGGTTYEEALSLSRGQNTIVPITELVRVGALLLSKGQHTIVPSSLIITNDNIALSKDLSSTWIGNIITPQAVILAIVNKTITLVGGLLYAANVSLDITNRTSVSSASLSRAGSLTLGKGVGVSFVSQLDAVSVVSFVKDLGIVVAGNIITPQTILLDRNLGLTLDGNIVTPQSLSLGKDKGVSFTGGLLYATALALAKSSGLTQSVQIELAGTLSLNKDVGVAITNFLTRAGAIILNNIYTIALNGTLIIPQSISFVKDLGIAQSAQADFVAAISIAKFVAFIPTHEFISGSAPSIPTYTGNIKLIEDVTGIVEIIEQARGNIVLIETPTGTLILDLTL